MTTVTGRCVRNKRGGGGGRGGGGEKEGGGGGGGSVQCSVLRLKLNQQQRQIRVQHCSWKGRCTVATTAPITGQGIRVYIQYQTADSVVEADHNPQSEVNVGYARKISW